MDGMRTETKWRQRKKRIEKGREGKGREGTDGREGNSTNADVYGLRLTYLPNQQQIKLLYIRTSKTQGSGFSSLAYRRAAVRGRSSRHSLS